MSPITITLLLLLVALVLFATEKLPVDIVGILLVIGLVLAQVLTAQEGLAGFGNDIIITIGGLFILVGGLVKTGIVDIIGRRLYKIAGDSEFLLTGLIMAAAALSASVLKNTTTTAMFLPVVLGLAAKAKIPPSKLLMPLAFGAILGGSCTLIGTSTNLAVSGAIQRYGQAPFSLFELTPVGIIMVGFGIIYMLFIGRKMLPARGGEDSLADRYSIREYTSELLVLPGSRLVGKNLAESNISTDLELNVLGILRGDERLPARNYIRIQMNDLLIVEGRISDILRVKEEDGLEIKPDFKLNDTDFVGENIRLFEVMVMRDSSLVGQTLKSSRFRQKYDLTVLAINRHGEQFISKLSGVTLKFGDVLLVQGSRDEIEQLVGEGEMILLEDVSATSVRVDKRKWAVAGFLTFLALSLSKIVTGYEIPLAICVLLGVMVLLATKTVRHTEMYSLIDFRLLVLIACMMSFGVAMEKTRHGHFPRRLYSELRRTVWRNGRACGVFSAYRGADAAHVEPGRGAGRAPGGGKNGGRAGAQPAYFYHGHNLRGLVLVYHPARTRVCTRLHPGRVPFYGLCQDRHDTDDRRVRDLDRDGPEILAVLRSGSRFKDK